MATTVNFTKVVVDSISIAKQGEAYGSSVGYTVQNADGSESSYKYSSKCTSAGDSEKLSVGSDALVINFINSITTLMTDREEL